MCLHLCGCSGGCDFFFLAGIISAGLLYAPVKLGFVLAWAKDFVFEVDEVFGIFRGSLEDVQTFLVAEQTMVGLKGFDGAD